MHFTIPVHAFRTPKLVSLPNHRQLPAARRLSQSPYPSCLAGEPGGIRRSRPASEKEEKKMETFYDQAKSKAEEELRQLRDAMKQLRDDFRHCINNEGTFSFCKNNMTAII